MSDAPRGRRLPAPVVIVDVAPRCWRCKRKIAESVGRPWRLVCHRCKAQNASAPPDLA